MNVPFLDLGAQHAPLRSEIMAALGDVVDQNAFAGGPFVAKFEEDFALYCGSRYAVGVGNGTDALWLALLALGVGPGDEVITAPNSFIATAEAISLTGAVPVFVDIDPRTYTLDPARLTAAISPRTKAIMPVQLYGQMADMDAILEIASRHGLPVVEDACQAHGAEYRGRRAGSIGRLGCFSFYPGKNLGAWGEAGAVVTDDPLLAKKMRVFRDHGQEKKYFHSCIGWNARMDGMQAAVLSIKLRSLDRGNAARRAHAVRYAEGLAGIPGLEVEAPAAYAQHSYHLYVVRVEERSRLLEALGRRGIACGIHYPCPIHRQEAYRDLGLGEGTFPVTERYADQILSLPMYPELSVDQIETVVAETRALLTEFARTKASVA
jgi:dTDP-4-amino-4,6-dideoxygalactose transaminase